MSGMSDLHGMGTKRTCLTLYDLRFVIRRSPDGTVTAHLDKPDAETLVRLAFEQPPVLTLGAETVDDLRWVLSGDNGDGMRTRRGGE